MEKPKPHGGKRENAGRKLTAESKKRVRSIMLSDAEFEQLSEIAKARGLTRSMLIVAWIQESLKDDL